MSPSALWRTGAGGLAGALLLLASIAGAAAAQQVRGVVLLPDSVTTASSVIVTATDARGIVVARSITGARGEFALALPAPGRVTVRALRVGYRPTETPEREVASGDTVALRIVLNVASVRLAAITVRQSDPWRARDDRRVRVVEVCEEARKALVLANAARTGDALVAEWTQYDRQLDSLGERVLDPSVQRTRAPSERPVRSLEATALARDGYIVEDAAGVSYYAPDADVLLSDPFGGAHCFPLVDGEPGDGRIGVRFRPIDESRQRRDVTGTLWLDRESAELRFLEFAYTSLPSVADRGLPGGRVEFRRIADGAWLVTRWYIRMPDLERIIPNRATSARVRVTGPSIALRGVKVVGGEVTQVERSGEVVYRAAGASLVVRVMLPDAEDPVRRANARVSLVGTDYETRADSGGIARFPLVLPGHYRIAVSSPALEIEHDPPARGEVEIRGDTARTLQVRLPARRMTAAALGLAPRSGLRAAVAFTVADSLGTPVPNVEIGAVDAKGKEHRLRADSLGRAFLDDLSLGDMRVEARLPGYSLAYGTIVVAEGITPAKVLLERVQGGQVLGAVRIEAEGDERARYGAFEARRRAGVATASITREAIRKRNPVNGWQMLQNISAIEVIDGPAGAMPATRRTKSMDLRSNIRPCYIRMAIDGVLLPDNPVNLRDRMPPVPEIHGIEFFAGPATIPSECVGDQRDMV